MIEVAKHKKRQAGSSRFFRSKTRRVVAGVGIGIFSLPLMMFSTIHFYPALAANAADSILRPIIGNTATIAIESFFFSINDALQQTMYKFGTKPSAAIFSTTTPVAAPLVSQQKVTTFNLQPITFHPGSYARLPQEGDWSVISLPQFKGGVDMAQTFVLPDPARAYAVTSLVKINMRAMHLHAVAGTAQPGGPIGNSGPGVIDQADQAGHNLVAAFNGGFQYKDGQYGMAVGAKTYVPMQDGLGTLIVHKDNTVSIEQYSAQQTDLSQALLARQNGPLIVQDGAVTPATLSGGMQRWGLTVTDSMYTWRSGVGVTKNGNLVYAVGPSLNTNTLAIALQAGGAVNAIQLDINPYWVRFVLFQPTTVGAYSYSSLLKAMQSGGYSYLHGYNKDFFYLTMAN